MSNELDQLRRLRDQIGGLAETAASKVRDQVAPAQDRLSGLLQLALTFAPQVIDLLHGVLARTTDATASTVRQALPPPRRRWRTRAAVAAAVVVGAGVLTYAARRGALSVRIGRTRA